MRFCDPTANTNTNTLIFYISVSPKGVRQDLFFCTAGRPTSLAFIMNDSSNPNEIELSQLPPNNETQNITRDGDEFYCDRCRCNSPMEQWLIWKLLSASVATPVVVFGLMILCKLLKSLRTHFTSPKAASLVVDALRRMAPDGLDRPSLERSRDMFGQLQIGAQYLTSTTNPYGQILNFLTFTSSMMVFVIYLTEVSHRNHVCLRSPTECLISCYPYDGFILNDKVAALEFSLNCLFAVCFLLRLVAAQCQQVSVLFDLFAMVDYCTVPPAFLSVYFSQSWTGLRFVRVLYLLNVPEFLQYIQLLRNRNPIRLCQLICTITAILLTTAGMFHLLESSTDLFNESHVLRETALSYWEYVYFCIVTAGTVGYGDIKCITSQGKIFNAIFILSTLAVVASVLPDMFRIISHRKKYGGFYSERGGRKHIVVCGNINSVTAGRFLREFLHKDRGACDTKVIFLDLKAPDLDMENIIKSHFNDVEYLQGSVMHGADLKRAKAETCEACIIAANKFSSDPDAEDAANIMRVISVKNHNSSTRVIVELMQYHNKAYLLNIPSWNWKCGDEFVCLAELKLGLIAQSCLAPGFSTFCANLFMSCSVSSQVMPNEFCPGWKSEYLRGTGMEMYTEVLSYAFVGLTFAETAELCLLKLDILLLAVSLWDPQTEEYTLDINPKPSSIIEPRTQGFFIADSAEDAQRAASYCSVCHAEVNNAELITTCECGYYAFSDNKAKIMSQGKLKGNRNHFNKRGSLLSSTKADDGSEIEISLRNRMSVSNAGITVGASIAYELLEPHPGTYLVVPVEKTGRSNDTDCAGRLGLGTSGQVPDLIGFDDQIKNCKFDSTGMFHWRAPSPFESVVVDRYAAAKKQFRCHVVVGIFADGNSPLIGLNNLVMPLRSSNFGYDELKPIIFLGNIDYLAREWKNLHNFPKIAIVKGSALSRADLRALSIHHCSMCVILTAKIPHTNDANLTDKEVIMASLNIKAMDCEPRVTSAVNSRQNSFKGLSRKGSRACVDRYVPRTRVPMITDLFNDSNVQFLDPDDDDDDANPGFYATEPFACGTAFTASVLDSLMSMVYFNPNAFRVIRALIFGGASSEFEEILAEGAGLIGGIQMPEQDMRSRPYVTQILLTDRRFAEYAMKSFGDLFVAVLHRYGILCLGIFRLLNEQGGSNGKRYVITKPPANYRLHETDHIFALMQSDVNVDQEKEIVERVTLV